MTTPPTHPVHQIKPGMTTGLVSALLGQPSWTSTVQDESGKDTVTDWWHYREAPSGHNTHIIVEAGKVTAVLTVATTAAGSPPAAPAAPVRAQGTARTSGGDTGYPYAAPMPGPLWFRAVSVAWCGARPPR